MSLRDDLVNQQKEQSQKNREKAKEEKALSLQREQNYKQQKAQLQKQKEDAFDAFAQQVKEGHVPDEWVKLYDGYVEKIKEHILKGNLSFHFKDAVTADYYQEKASVNKGKNSVVTLMNDYLTKRLKQDGFSSAKFRLVDEITYYATEQDYADQQARQEINDAKAQADYENSWNNWYNYDTGGRAPLQSDFKPKQAKLVKTGEEHNYYFVVSGSLYRKSSGKEVDTDTDLKIHGIFAAVFGVLFGIFGFAFPFIFPPEKTLPVIGFGFGNPIGSLFIFLIAGEIFAAFAAFIVNCFRHMRNAVNKKRRVLSVVVVSLFLVCVIAGGTAFATLFPFEKVTSGGVTYQKAEDGESYSVVSIDENASTITLHENLRGVPVKEFPSLAQYPQVKTVECDLHTFSGIFENASSLEKVVLNAQLTEIEANAFKGCTSLTEVVLPSSVTEIGNNAFQGCSSLKKINLGDNLSYVGEYAFQGCGAVEEVYFGRSFSKLFATSFSGWEGILKIEVNCENNFKVQDGEYVFDTKSLSEVEFVLGKDVVFAKDYNLFSAENNNITQITFAEGCAVETLYGTFNNFSCITSVTLPETVTKISSCFVNCYMLESMDLSQIPAENCSPIFQNCYALQFVRLPEELRQLSSGAFLNCTSLRNISLPNSVNYIGWAAFEGCSALTSFVIPESVTVLESGLFKNCSSLTEITIPDTVTEIQKEVFSGCSSLQSVSLPASLTALNDSLFEGCSSLTQIVIPDTVTSIGDSVFADSGITQITLPASLRSVGNSAFKNTKLTEVTIPATVTELGTDVFYGCSRLKTANISCNVTALGNHFFDGCTLLNSVSLPQNLKSIGWAAFSKCNSLQSFTMPSSVTFVDGYAFAFCSALTTVDLSSSAITSLEEGVFAYCKQLQQVSLPSALKSIGGYAFDYCTNLQTVVIPQSVSVVDSEAFYNCNNLTVYCRASSQPSGWESGWNRFCKGVVWRYNG